MTFSPSPLLPVSSSPSSPSSPPAPPSPSSPSSPSSHPSQSSTAGYYALFLCLGLNVGVIGPTLISLGQQTHTPVGGMGEVFLAGSIGWTLGTVIGGRLFDRAPGHPVLGTAQLFSASLLCLVPAVPSLWLLLTLLFFKGIADGIINTGANTLLGWVHGENVGPYMNGMHFCFGLGAFLSPMLVAQVLGPPSGFHRAYWILGAFAALVGLGMFTLTRSPHRHRLSKTDEIPREPLNHALIAATALYLFFYVGAELAFAGWIYTYGFTLRLTTATGSAYLNSIFWLSFTIGRLISIPAATRFKPAPVVVWNGLACLLLLVALVVRPGSQTLLWIVTGGFGFFLAPLWPTGFSLACRWLKPSSGVTSIILVGDSCGALILPWLVGAIIGSAGPTAMVSLVFGSLLLALASFAAMLRLRPTGVLQ